MHDTNEAFVPVGQPVPNPQPIPMSEVAEPGDLPQPGENLPRPRQWPTPLPHFCSIQLLPGCYAITIATNVFSGLRGTIRVEQNGGSYTMSGDLYAYRSIIGPPHFPTPPVLIPRLPLPDPGPVIHQDASDSDGDSNTGDGPGTIPIYSRSTYRAYLKGTSVKKSPTFTYGACQLVLGFDEYDYTQPAAGSFNGTFPSVPSRSVVATLAPQATPNGYLDTYYTGTLTSGTNNLGSVTFGRVSTRYRRAVIDIHAMSGAATPAAVGGEDFTSVFATAGWDVSVVVSPTVATAPPGTTTLTSGCPSEADLHALMDSVRNPAVSLDSEWRMYVLAVKAKMGCGRGVMFDEIGAPREGVATFSDDGYPTSDSASFGAAADQKQRNVPRAFLRSACHEVGHGFNQQHQEIASYGEPGADNSIMTTSPSVANVLGGPATGAPGVFPDQINLAFNDHVRHHLIHHPDPVVRPGGMSFGTGHTSTVPTSDEGRTWIDQEQLPLTLEVKARGKLGEPLLARWTLRNATNQALGVPTDVSIEAQHAYLQVVDPDGKVTPVPSFVIRTDHVSIGSLGPGDSASAETRLFWGSHGFAFTSPGPHQVQLRIVWNQGGLAWGVRTTAEVWVDYPVSQRDNDVAAAMFHPEVGKFVALGGGPHLHEAARRIEGIVAEHAEHPAAAFLAAYAQVENGTAAPAGKGGAGRRRVKA